MVFGMFTCRDYMKSMSAVMFEYNMFKISCRYLQPFREINFSNKYESRNRAAIFVTAQFETWFSELMRLTRDNMRPLFKLYHSLRFFFSHDLIKNITNKLLTIES